MRHLLPRLLLIVVILTGLSACAPGTAPGPATAAPSPAATSAPVATIAPVATTAPKATTEPTATTAPAAVTTAPTSTPDPAANAPRDQAAVELLLEASKAQLAQKAFRATITGKDPDGKDQTTVLEYVNPDSYHMVTAGTEIIIVKEGTFIKEGSGQWQKSPIDVQGMISQIMSEQSIEKLVKDVNYEDVELVGADLIGGKPMWVYRYQSTIDAGGTNIATESRNWIGALDRLPYRIDAISDAAGDAKVTTTIVYEYDDAIRIDVPEVSG